MAEFESGRGRGREEVVLDGLRRLWWMMELAREVGRAVVVDARSGRGRKEEGWEEERLA